MEPTQFSPAHKKIFQELGVEAVYLFGSHAKGYTTPLSDIDIGIVFRDPAQYRGKTLEAHTRLYNVFSELFPDAKEIDVVFLQFTPPSLQFAAVRDGAVLYRASANAECSYRERTLKAHADLRHFNALRYQSLLQRI